MKEEDVENDYSRCESCNKYFKDSELEFVENHGVICNNCKVSI